jgi:hypothetical protein
MYVMLHGMVMDGHASLTSTSLSILYHFDNVLYIWTLFLLPKTFVTHGHALSRFVTNYSILPVLTYAPSL